MGDTKGPAHRRKGPPLAGRNDVVAKGDGQEMYLNRRVGGRGKIGAGLQNQKASHVLYVKPREEVCGKKRNYENGGRQTGLRKVTPNAGKMRLKGRKQFLG